MCKEDCSAGERAAVRPSDRGRHWYLHLLPGQLRPTCRLLQVLTDGRR